MAEILTFFRKIFCFLLGCFYASLILLKMFIDFLRSPLKYPRSFNKKREMPSCLNDPSLGTHGFIHLEDVNLHYVSCGDEKKPLMLLLHGYPGFWYSWKYQIPEFSKDYRVVAVDQRGYADSGKPSGWRNYTIDKLAGDIRQLIPALGHKSCVLVGHDWGGIVAWHFACHNPHLVDRLVICNAPNMAVMQKHLYSNVKQFFKSWYMFFFQVPLLPELMFMANDMEFFKIIFKPMPNNRPSREDEEAYKYTFSAKGAVTNPLNWYRAIVGHKPVTCPVFEKPVLTIWGEPDLALNTEIAYLAEEVASNLTVKVLENTHHQVIIDKYKEVNDEIRQFLSK